VDELIIASRAVHFTAVALLFGAPLFRLAVAPDPIPLEACVSAPPWIVLRSVPPAPRPRLTAARLIPPLEPGALVVSIARSGVPAEGVPLLMRA